MINHKEYIIYSNHYFISFLFRILFRTSELFYFMFSGMILSRFKVFSILFLNCFKAICRITDPNNDNNALMMIRFSYKFYKSLKCSIVIASKLVDK